MKLREGRAVVHVMAVLRAYSVSMLGSQAERFGGRRFRGGRWGDWCS
jgi:hypothetical protein